ncbi:MAG: hypothetical protein NDJ19_03325, partial [Ramlibacter sp.]|nr:hypothetical protein [Ramlibacter sp.]
RMDLRPAVWDGACPWLLVAAEFQPAMASALETGGWNLVSTIRRPVDKDDYVLLFEKADRQ